MSEVILHDYFWPYYYMLSVIVLTPICSTFFEKRVGLVTDPVIQAIGRPKFEDGLRMGVLLQDC